MNQAYIVAALAGEMKASDIPLSRAVSEAQLEALLAGDDDPLPVVIEIAPGKSGRGWNYTAKALQKLVAHVEERSLSGIMGHQTEEQVSHEFRPPVTHWVGAKWDRGKAYFRGVVDKTAPDLKRWIKSGRVTQPSIFTRPTLVTNSKGEQDVVDLEPLSIDWAPLDRAGMSTARLYSYGEMADGEGTDPPKNNSQEGTRRMERSEQIAEAVKLDARAFVADAAVHDSGWAAIDQAVRAVQSSGVAAGELATTLSTAKTDAAQAQGELAAIAALDGKPVDKAREVATSYKTRAETAESKLADLQRATLEPRVVAIVGEMNLPKGIRALFEPALVAFCTGKDCSTEEKLKGYAGELRQQDPWPKALEDVTTSTGASGSGQRTGNGSTGPDMSVFGTSTVAIGA